MTQPTILAFMQNMWLKDPERVKATIERLTRKHGAAWAENYRRKLIAYALFAGCASGRNLQLTFGEDLCQQIRWEEASRVITSQPNECPPADLAHIDAALKHYKPDIVVCFGRIACNAVPDVWKGPLVRAPHPAARHADTMDRLRQAAAHLRTLAGIAPTHDPIS